MDLDVISCVGFRSGDQRSVSVRGGGAGSSASRFCGGTRLGLAGVHRNRCSGGSNRPGLGPRMISVSCVIHLGLKRGSAGLWAARATAEAALRGGAHRRAVFVLCWGLVWRPKGLGSLRSARASLDKALHRAVVQGNGRAMVAEALRMAVLCRMAFWPPGSCYGYDRWRLKRKDRSRRCSPSVWIGQGRCAGGSAAAYVQCRGSDPR